MNIISKLQPVWIITAAVFGILLGRSIPGIALAAEQSVKYFLMLLLLFVFLNIKLKEITKSFLNIRFSLSALSVNFIWTPVFAFVLTLLFFRGNVDVQLGFLMLLLTPCTDWYLIFTALSGGNVPLGSSILPLNLLLQIVLLPLYLLLFMGSAVHFDMTMMARSIIFALVIPLALANGIKVVAAKLPVKDVFNPPQAVSALPLVREGRFVPLGSDNLQFLFLCLAIIAMFASQGNYMLENPLLFITILPPLIIFFIVNFFLALGVGKKLKLPFEDRIPLVFTTSARNSPVALAIAGVTFPDKPLVLLVLVAGPLIELPVLALNSIVLKRRHGRLLPGP
jgi:ACR3 family arsenite efflux pump ArsB